MSFLMPSQRQNLFSYLEGRGFNPFDFEMVASTSNSAFQARGDKLHMLKTDYYFAIYPYDGEYTTDPKFWVEFSPGEEKMQDYDSCHTWQTVLHTFDQYLKFLGREVAVIDPWKAARKFVEAVEQIPSSSSSGADDEMNPAEEENIRRSLDDIKKILLEHVKRDEVKTKYIEDQIGALKNASTKLNKKDYKGILISAVIGLMIAIAVPPDARIQIFNVLGRLVQSVPQLIA